MFEVRGVVGVTPQKYICKLSICFSAPETIACLEFI